MMTFVYFIGIELLQIPPGCIRPGCRCLPSSRSRNQLWSLHYEERGGLRYFTVACVPLRPLELLVLAIYSQSLDTARLEFKDIKKHDPKDRDLDC